MSVSRSLRSKSTPAKTHDSKSKQLSIADSFNAVMTEKGLQAELPTDKSSLNPIEENSISSLRVLLQNIDKKWSKNYADLQSSLTTKLESIETKFDKMYNSLKNDIEGARKDMSEEVKGVKQTVADVEKSIAFHADKLNDYDKKLSVKEVELQAEIEQNSKALENKMSVQMKELQVDLLKLQLHSRKCNLLFTGVPGKCPDENVYTTLRKHLVNVVKMEEE